DVEAWLDPDDDFWLAEDDCTCPMGGDCKHVVATLIAARRLLEKDLGRIPASASDSALGEVAKATQDRQEELALDEWLKLLQTRAAPEAPPTPESLLYQLAPNGLGKFRLQFYKTRRSKDGTYA